MDETRQTILITGGAAGIGRGILLHFRDMGWRACVLDRDREALAELRAMFPAGDCLALQCDAGVEGEVEQAFAALEGWLKDAPLFCLVNNAGIADPYCGPLEKVSLADWNRWMDASLTAAFLCSRAALPLLRRGAGASIVNISSTRSLMSEPESFAYAAAKGGIDALTHAMAVSLGPDIRVNAILPGWIETGPMQKAAEREQGEHTESAKSQHPAGRIGTVADIAGCVEYLVGAGFVTGTRIVIDGGMTRKMIYHG
ncbi:SDR family NAD(P)-dependent oxidoreductase [Pseudopontixanthobacter vadosimaris]|uniref:SDR family NAD(P)-dependent oxidoreductase n=1 Tax=Pseudopontixanthobacter vadosimaris TaxID=2726450 RepID=UPI00147449E3|nr:SDR family oxidoreductase [Pseudopontixanthobacter vadosimaris]